VVDVEETLRRIEAAHDLLRYTVDGWCAWPLIRSAVATGLQNLPLSEPGAGVRPGLARLAEAARGAPRLLGLRRASYFVKSYSSGLAERSGDKYKDVWVDDLLLALGDHVKLEAVNSPELAARRAHAMLPAHLTAAPLEAAAGVLARAGAPRELTTSAVALARALASELGQGALGAATVDRHLRHFRATRRVYRAVLGRVRPRCVLTVDPGEYALVAAAKELGIATVELQHGFLDRVSHPAYAWTGYAAPYKARMAVPDRLFLYGEHWKEELLANGFWGDSLRAVGSVRVDRYRQARSPRRPGDAFRVIFSTQGLDVGRCIGFLREFIALGGPERELRLAIKLHPVYDRRSELYREAFGGDPRVEVLGADEGRDTFELIAASDLHVSISSTCHYEAIGLGVPTAVLPFATHEVMAPLCRRGHATPVRTPAELWQLVRRIDGGGPPPVPAEHYFKPGALENMLRELGAWRAPPARPAPTG
jgi:hypothetical protein